MFDLRDLYQEVILDHNKRPRNFGQLARPDRRAEGYNPLCGDQLTLQIELDGEVIRDVAFDGSGCAISKASASLMTESVKGKTLDEVRTLFEKFQEMVTADAEVEPDTDALGKLSVFAGVRAYPARVKCAVLAWHTLRSAVEGADDVATTE
ncbi:MAG: SUF system NifU family Fe-S cluster assembly protein [Vicinamibacterales bacterium]|jgi:nitrogen fixation NifU-like protein|nr:SUF system NifU family Fe-S cluster assembly protein [Acidobacteriota bacterium]MDP6371667.1 SUF system NifU family Fe-S cluster assembly protein [Vicinamibacterales bacterium]MDP6608002.1 SUF system NifU family Fe-S cluster assembly protein [Vicinamibacterales bacterium]HAK54619.1 SUF system NifU family Fe-S cluster assembly protein [Acidobacteriota bacterium]|tara:strand:- start:4128 stop:4580 length:453 start_codon:yes stop_codon:yes gene_type:complete